MGLMQSNSRFARRRRAARLARAVELAYWAEGRRWRDQQEAHEAELAEARTEHERRRAATAIAVHRLNQPRGG